MPKLTFKEEKEVRRRIWRALPYERRRFGEIADRAKVAERTLSKYLKIWVALKAVLHEGEFYRRNPTFDLPYDDFRERLSSGFQTVGDDFEFIKVRGTQRSGSEADRFLSQLNLETERLYCVYIRLLKMMDQVPTRMASRELFDLFFAVEVQPRFNLLVEYFWRKRDTIKIQNVDPFIALMRFHAFPFQLGRDFEKVYGVSPKELNQKRP